MEMENQNMEAAPVMQEAVVQEVVQESVQITSGQVEYAGFWVRFAATFVDGLVLLIPNAIVNAATHVPLAGWVLTWAYAIYMLNDRQATLGKMAAGIKVTSVDAGKPTLGKLALREIVGKFLNILTLCIGYIMIAFTAKKQGLHDMLAGTVVVYDPARKRRPWLTVVGIIAGLIIPTIGIIAGIVLVSTSSAKDRASFAGNMALGVGLIPEMVSCIDDNGSINLCNSNDCSAVRICSAPNHKMMWPKTIQGWKINAKNANNDQIENYSFTISSPDQKKIITCSVASGECK